MPQRRPSLHESLRLCTTLRERERKENRERKRDLLKEKRKRKEKTLKKENKHVQEGKCKIALFFFVTK